MMEGELDERMNLLSAKLSAEMDAKFTELLTELRNRSLQLDSRILRSTDLSQTSGPRVIHVASLSENVDVSTKENDMRKVDTFEEFCGYTTLHGLRFIGDRTSVIPRRIFWVLLVLLCGTLFSLQVYDRFNYFLESPITVNYMVNYPDRVVFPAVTICNQNNFRLSKAYDGDWLEFLHDFYQEEDVMPPSSEQHLNTSIAELFEGLAHTKEDFIARCQWADEECSAANFTTTLTSNGVCFTFNKVNRSEDLLTIQASGVEHALRLTLNTENYENLQGPHDTTGIKMLMTDQNEIPRVKEIGIALSTGVHAFVGNSVLTVINTETRECFPLETETVEIFNTNNAAFARKYAWNRLNTCSHTVLMLYQLNNLPPPHGECEDVPLVSTGSYNKYTCLAECETRYAYQECGCRHFYMPDLTGNMSVCSLRQFLTCLQPVLDNFNNVSQTVCTCPISCLYNIYEPTVSTSNFKDDVGHGVDIATIKKRFFAAKEISTKIDERLQGDFNETLTMSIETVLQMIEYLQSHLFNYIWSEKDLISDVFDTLNTSTYTMENEYSKTVYIIRNNLMPQGDMMEITTFRFVCRDYTSFIKEVELWISEVLWTLWWIERYDEHVDFYNEILINILHTKQDHLNRAQNNFTQLINLCKHAQTELVYNTNLRNELSQLETKLDMLNQFTYNLSKIVTSIETIATDLRNFTWVNETVWSTFYETIDGEMKQLIAAIQQACDLFMFTQQDYMKLLESIDDYLKEWGVNVDETNVLWIDFETKSDDLNDIINSLDDLILGLSYTLPSLLDELFKAQKYLNDEFPLITKYDIAETNSYGLKLDSVEAIVSDIAAKTFTHGLDWAAIEQILRDVRKLRIGFEGNNVITNMTIRISSLETRIDISGHDIQALKSVIVKLDEHHANHAMDDEFYRRNFLLVDVYFKEIRSEEIVQQKAYDEIALFCDIGGAAGLLIGGSVITVFEIVEFVLMCLVCKVCFKRTKLCKCKVAPDLLE